MRGEEKRDKRKFEKVEERRGRGIERRRGNTRNYVKRKRKKKEKG